MGKVKSVKPVPVKSSKPKAKPVAKKTAAMKVPLRKIKPSEYFVLSNGKQIKSLADLRLQLSKMDDGLFYCHVNDGKNDFATWVYHAVGDKNLAKRMGPLKQKAANLKAVQERLKRK